MKNFAVPSGHEDSGRRAVLLRQGKAVVYPVSSCLGCKQSLKHQQGCFRGPLKSLPDCTDTTSSPLPAARAAPRPGEGSVSLQDGRGVPRDATAAPVEAAYSIASQGLGLLSHHPFPRFSPFTGGSIAEHRCKHQTPSRVPVPGVTSVVQPGVRVAKQPVSHRWVSMVMEQE